MTLDEAIKREVQASVDFYDLADSYHTDENVYIAQETMNRDIAEYHDQLVEWLKELQECREIMEFIDSNVRVIETNDGVMIRFGGGNVCEWARRKGEHI